MKCLRLLFVALAVLALCVQAGAVNLPGSAKIKMKFTNWDMGALYSGATNGGVYDLTGGLGALTKTACPYANTWEDGWGIFTLSQIQADSGSGFTTVWESTANDTQITGMFWDISDDQLIQLNTKEQYIKGNELKFAFWEQKKTGAGVTPWAPGDTGLMTRPSWRDSKATSGGATIYLPSFSENYLGTDYSLTDGTLLWTGYGVPGAVIQQYMEASPGDVDPGYEFHSQYNVSNNSSNGGFYGKLGTVGFEDVDGSGTQFTNSMTGTRNSMFDEWLPGGDPAYPADFEFEFTAESPSVPTSAPPPDSANDNWLLESDDPVRAQTPELPTTVLMLMGLLPVGLAWVRRRKDD